MDWIRLLSQGNRQRAQAMKDYADNHTTYLPGHMVLLLVVGLATVAAIGAAIYYQRRQAARRPKPRSIRSQLSPRPSLRPGPPAQDKAPPRRRR